MGNGFKIGLALGSGGARGLAYAGVLQALEEAGIEGVIGVEILGSYVYEKWGAATTCHVYPMEVTREIAHEDWQENHRQRTWVSTEQAAAQLRQPQLGPMVEALAARLRTR